MDLRQRVLDARQALGQARIEGDFYSVDVRTGELDSLTRIATENGIDLPAAQSATADLGSEQ
ncbi:hypothetical protein E1263_10240 [Kribbella antibiotica]|uniref:Uncharacterized protein n=1 Tax=Kribbella antibiotica TaxID=190195 RepID=A0A4V2YQ55_9ACTN|nr:hypothetical protein E1263_10240 [Kribbella antibiotica]